MQPSARTQDPSNSPVPNWLQSAPGDIYSFLDKKELSVCGASEPVLCCEDEKVLLDVIDPHSLSGRMGWVTFIAGDDRGD